ncbi:hypothetical protein PUMCH_004235 [Australozyma saopauloensis]|uniref:SAP domain-containing protein n=1 Tax=Australozyma saopauloensis TaxID=291208 RepID=A0AAX4HEB2_9ASCO|nr:hypothetical protein PUMCH_004235 [[Candida] saopauloensis]
MSELSALTVAQLKEALKEKGLSVDGKKADLVARLTEAQESTNELDEVEEEKAPQEEAKDDAPEAEVPAIAAEKAAEPEQAAAAEPAAETEKEEKPEKKVLTPEERKQMAVDLLTKKIKRAEKFGDEAAATAAKKDLARVEKFGVDPSTALAKEIGALNRDVNTELSNKKFRRGNGKGKGKGKGKVSKNEA